MSPLHLLPAFLLLSLALASQAAPRPGDELVAAAKGRHAARAKPASQRTGPPYAQREDAMRFADEIADPGDFELPRVNKKPTQQEVKMASSLVDGLHADFDPDAFEDSYRGAVLKLVDAKATGKNIELPEPEEAEAADDLLAQLEASLKS